MRRRAFTLIEMIMAVSATAILLVAIYGVFSKAVKMRDTAVERTRMARVQMRAVDVIRTDLRNAIVTGGTMAATLESTREGRSGSFPDNLKIVATTARRLADEDVATDLQRIEYYVTDDPNAVDRGSGVLMRAAERNLLAPVEVEVTEPEQLLTGVKSMAVSFYDGTSWVDSWQVSETETDLPKAIRVTIVRAPDTVGGVVPAPIEVLVPWTTERAVEAETTGGTQ